MTKPELLHGNLRRRNNLSGASFILFALMATRAGAALYYVSPTGSDSDPDAGTLERPFASLQKGHDRAAPGDTVYIRGGIYNIAGNRANGVTLGKSGQSGRRICFWNYKAEKPVFDFSGLKFSGRISGFRITGSWLHLKGLEVRKVLAPSGVNYGTKLRSEFRHRPRAECRRLRLPLPDNRPQYGIPRLSRLVELRRRVRLVQAGGSGYHRELLGDGKRLSGAKVHFLRNNAAFENRITNIGASNMQFNSWNLGISVNANDFVSLSDAGMWGPCKADGGLPDTDFMKLREGSRLIDRGTGVGFPFIGSAPDLGAYEYGTTVTRIRTRRFGEEPARLSYGASESIGRTRVDPAGRRVAGGRSLSAVPSWIGPLLP